MPLAAPDIYIKYLLERSKYNEKKIIERSNRAVNDILGDTGYADYLGISGKDILCGSGDRLEALLELARKLDAGSRDLAVLFSGADVPAEEAQAASDALTSACPRTEVTLIEGGQPVYDYILLLC